MPDLYSSARDVAFFVPGPVGARSGRRHARFDRLGEPPRRLPVANAWSPPKVRQSHGDCVSRRWTRIDLP